MASASESETLRVCVAEALALLDTALRRRSWNDVRQARRVAGRLAAALPSPPTLEERLGALLTSTRASTDADGWSPGSSTVGSASAGACEEEMETDSEPEPEPRRLCTQKPELFRIVEIGAKRRAIANN